MEKNEQFIIEALVAKANSSASSVLYDIPGTPNEESGLYELRDYTRDNMFKRTTEVLDFLISITHYLQLHEQVDRANQAKWEAKAKVTELERTVESQQEVIDGFREASEAGQD